MLEQDSILYGADYNPDQWLDYPEILEQDIVLMKKAHMNVVTLGIFAWTALEPEEGVYRFEWLDQVIARLAKENIRVILATPSGARPAWMSRKYPEVLRTTENRLKNIHGMRHNHCFTSPVYREKVYAMNHALAQRYKDNDNIIAWHISNEYGGECHCPLCQEAFRKFLKEKYKTLDALNHAWWSAFWSHTFTQWEEIESPSSIGELFHHAQVLDWKRFVTAQTIDFYKWEVSALRAAGDTHKATANFESISNTTLDLWKFEKAVDFIAVDIYPQWENNHEELYQTAQWDSFMNVINRSYHKKPYMLMETAPNRVNWHPVNKLKRPGLSRLSIAQAIANGADGVSYFQFRSSRGSSEKFHAAVVEHKGDSSTRTFREAAQVGQDLQELSGVLGKMPKVEVGLMFDFENRNAIGELQGLRKDKKDYLEVVLSHYASCWNHGVAVDILEPASDFNNYKMILMPMQYALSNDLGEKLNAYVAAGGVLVTTCFSGVADENDLCHLGGFPGVIKESLGMEAEETQTYYDTDENLVLYHGQNYPVQYYCDTLALHGATSLAEYQDDFFAGTPAITKNAYGKGTAYYIGFRSETAFLNDFYEELFAEHGVQSYDLPKGVTVHQRGEMKFIFNWTMEPVWVEAFALQVPALDYVIITEKGE